LGGKLYADAYFSNHSGNNYLLRTIHEPSGMETGQFLNVTKYNKEISNTIVHQDKAFFFRENGNLVFVQWFMDHIIEITKDSISSLIDIKSKDVLTTDNIRIAMEKNAHTYTVELMQLNKYYHIYSFIEHGNWIIFQMQKGFSLLNIFLNKQTGESQVTGFWNDLLLSGKMGNPAVTIGCQDASGVYYYVSVRNISSQNDADDSLV